MKACDGTKHTQYSHIDYYEIFPADTRMLYSSENMSDDDDD